MASMLAEDGQLFVATRDTLFVLATETGAPLWSRQVDESTWSNASLGLPGIVVQGDVTE